MQKSVLSFSALLCVLLAMVAPLPAQELTTGTIAGKVVDPTGRGIAGAVIIATSQFGTRTAETDAAGGYILPFLRPATYTVRAEAPGGFTTVIRNDVSVGLNQKTNLDFTLEPGKTETITVSGRAPLVDVTSTSTSTNIKYSDFADAVPIGRSFTDTYAVAAGVVSGLGTGDGNYSISGASGLENTYLIDGVNITNTGYGGIGAYNINYGSLGTGVTSEFLDEVQIKTGGFEAEYGQALGGIINTIVKSGTNDFRGSVAWYSSPSALQSSRQLIKLDGGASNRVAEDVQDFAFSVGGPFVKDKLFYFFAVNPVLTTHHVTAQALPDPAFTAASAGVSVFDETGPTGFDAPNALVAPSAGREFDRKRTSNNYAGKINWQLSPKHQIEFSFFGDPSTGTSGPQRGVAVLYADLASGGGESEIKYGSDNQTLKWSAVFTPRFFVETQIGHHAGKFRETSGLNQHYYTDLRNTLEFFRGANSYDPGGGPVPLTLEPVTQRRGGIGFISNQDDENTTFSVKATNVFGKHEVKYGVQYDDISYRDSASYTGPSFNVQLPVSDPLTGAPVDADLNGVQDTVAVPTRGGALVNVRNGIGPDVAVAYDNANRFRVVRAGLGPQLPPTKATESAGFMQDIWHLLPRVTIKAGVRLSTEAVQGAGSFTLPFGTQNITLGGVTNRIFTPGTSTYTPDSYVFAGNLAPRLGVTWDVLGNGKSRAYMNWGRYYERVPNDLAIRALSNEVGISRQEFSDRDLTTPRLGGSTPNCSDGAGGTTACQPLAGGVFAQGVERTNVVAGTKLPYEDELSGGFAFEVTPNSSFELRTIYRTQGRALEDVQVNAIEQIQNFYYGYSYGYPYDPFGGSTVTPQSTAFPAATFGAYELANPGTKTVPKGGLYSFPKPTRRYKSLEFIYTRRFSDNWSVYANYRFSRLIGNYEGLFRNDNGQSDPNITSLYDFPNSPLMSGQFASGPLPADVSHVLHVYPSYQFTNKLRLGANFSWASGVPRTSMLAHPIYQNSGEIPGINPTYAYWADPGNSGNPATFVLRKTKSLGAALADPEGAPFGGGPFLFSYDPVKRGNLGRTPDLVTLDLHGDYPVQFGKSKLTVMLDVFNIFQSQEATLYDDNVELTAGVTDPDFLKPVQYQSPRQWRLAARWDF
jgi:carboxypeptidase family protein